MDPQSLTFRQFQCQFFHRHEPSRLWNAFVGRTKEQVDEVDCELVVAAVCSMLVHILALESGFLVAGKNL